MGLGIVIRIEKRCDVSRMTGEDRRPAVDMMASGLRRERRICVNIRCAGAVSREGLWWRQ